MEAVTAKSNSQEALLGDVDWKSRWVSLIESKVWIIYLKSFLGEEVVLFKHAWVNYP